MAGLQQTAQRRAVLRLAGHQAEQEDRVFRLSDKLRHLVDGGIRRGAHLRGPAGRQYFAADRAIDHILRQADESAARAALLGGAEGVGDHFRQRVRRGHLDGVFRHRAEHRHRIHTLVDLFGFIGAFHRAAQGHHRVAFAVGGGHTGDQVGAARAGGDQRHAGFTGNAPDGGGHKRGVGFVAYRNNANGGIQQ